MVKKLCLLLVLLLSVFMVLGCNGEDVEEGTDNGAGETTDPVETDGEVYELTLAHFFPATHPVETELVSTWIEAVKEATGGRVIVTSYPGGTLVGADDTYDGVVSGIADLGLSFFSYTRGRFPLLEAFELPGIVYESSEAASRAAWEGIKQLGLEEVQDTELMFVTATGPGNLFTTKPVRTMGDMNGLKVRAIGLTVETLKALGAVPDAMSQGEVYEALQRGLVEGNLAPIEVLQGWNQADVTDYLTMTPFLYNALSFLTMNSDKWDSLPDDIKDAILKVNENVHAEVAATLWDRQNESALEYVVNEKDMEVIELSEAESARWIEAVTPIQDDFVNRMSEQSLDGEGVLELVKRLAEEYGNQ